MKPKSLPSHDLAQTSPESSVREKQLEQRLHDTLALLHEQDELIAQQQEFIDTHFPTQAVH